MGIVLRGPYNTDPMGANSPLRLLGEDPVAFFMLAAAIIGAIALHEYAHALAADLQGDRLPRAMGRLSLNPARHLDPLGTLFIFLIGFGWGRPVEFRPNALSSKRFGAAIVAMAGPLMNVMLALVGAFAFAALYDGIEASHIEVFLFTFMSINLLLAIFNLIPVPPLDGSRLLTIFLPPKHQNVIFWLDRYGILLLFALLFFGSRIFNDVVDDATLWLLRFVGVEGA